MIYLLAALLIQASLVQSNILTYTYNGEILSVSISLEQNRKILLIGFQNQTLPQEFISCKVAECTCVDNIVEKGKHLSQNPVQSILDVSCTEDAINFRRQQPIQLVPYIFSHPTGGHRQLQTYTNASAVAYNDSDMTASLQVTSLLTIKWLFSSDGTSIDFGILWGQQSWLGIGFGQGMSNVDMFNIDIVNGAVRLYDLYSTSKAVPPIDSVQNLNLTQYTISNSSVKFRFTRKLSTGDSKDTVLAQNGSYTFCYAYTAAPMIEYHGSNKNCFQITLNPSGTQTNNKSKGMIIIMTILLLLA
ncbi:hypothetical protein pb186bvf_001039 [Paramecium bursaria]